MLSGNSVLPARKQNGCGALPIKKLSAAVIPLIRGQSAAVPGAALSPYCAIYQRSPSPGDSISGISGGAASSPAACAKTASAAARSSTWA